MGATLKLFRWCAFAALLFAIADQVHAESKADSDLVFDTLDPKEVNSYQRISRNVPEDSSLEEPEGHWLSTTVNRIKRSINSFFNSHSQDTSHSHREKRNNIRVPRQDPLGQHEDDEYDDDNDEYDNNANEGDEYVGGAFEQQEDTLDEYEPPVSQGTDVTSSQSQHNRNNETAPAFGYDDEDITAVNSGAGSSGDGETDKPLYEPDQNPVYFRISFTIMEPFLQAYNDRDSPEYKELANALAAAIEQLYENVPGTQSAQVIKIQKREADAFSSKVTIDLGSVGFSDQPRIKRELYDHLQRNHKLGNIQANTEDFQFRAFEDLPQTSCGHGELLCVSGECVPSKARCNGTNDCADGSDEVGCLDSATSTPFTYPPSIATAPSPTNPPIPPTTIRTIVAPTTEDFDIGSGEPDVPRQTCRADDAVRCADGSRSICSDQICDGTPDCDNGGDEKDCINDCAAGEFICDISRCIPVSKRCDGLPDCSDSTDEQDCPACKEGEIRCDNNKCIPSSRRCDRIPDCRDGTDEQNCSASLTE